MEHPQNALIAVHSSLRLEFECKNEAIVDSKLRRRLLLHCTLQATNQWKPSCVVIANPPVRNLLPLYTTTKSMWHNLANTLEFMTITCSTAHGAHVNITNTTYTPYGKITSFTKPEVHNVFHCSQKSAEPQRRITRAENFVKFGCVIFEIH